MNYYRKKINRRNNFSRRRKVREYFHHNSKFSWRSRVIIYFTIFVLIYFFYFFFFSEYFKIDNFIVEGNQEIKNEEIEKIVQSELSEKRYLFFDKSNYFLFNPEELEKRIEENYYLDDIEVEKKYYSLLNIKIEEKKPVLVYQVGDQNYLVDDQGSILSIQDNYEKDENNYREDFIIIKEIPQKIVLNQEKIDQQNNSLVLDNPLYKNTSSTVFVYNQSEEKTIIKEEDRISEEIEWFYPEIGKVTEAAFSEEIISYILLLDRRYNIRFNENPKRIYYEYDQEKEGFISMITDQDFQIHFEFREDLDSQLANLYRYIVEEKKYDLGDIEYIDLRYKNQIIIK